jgi:hypothetical protein
MLARFDDPQAMLVFTDGRLIDAGGAPMASTLWKEWQFNWTTRLRWRRPRLAVLDLVHNRNKVTGANRRLPPRAARRLLPIRVPPGYWHDAWLALHAAARGGLCFLSEPLIDYRVHGKQQIGITQDIEPRRWARRGACRSPSSAMPCAIAIRTTRRRSTTARGRSAIRPSVCSCVRPGARCVRTERAAAAAVP